MYNIIYKIYNIALLDVAQKMGMDRSAVMRTYGTSELHKRGLIRTYCEGILKWPGTSTT